MVNVTVLVPPRGTVLGEKSRENPGRFASAVKVSVAVPPFPALEVTSPVTLTKSPADPTVTSTEIVQLRPAPKRPLLSEMVDPPAGADRTASEHVVLAKEGVAIVVPAGRLSVTARSVAGSRGSRLVISISRVVTLPGPITSGLKILVAEGGWAPVVAAIAPTKRANTRLAPYRTGCTARH